jgi:hypothetical protein
MGFESCPLRAPGYDDELQPGKPRLCGNESRSAGRTAQDLKNSGNQRAEVQSIDISGVTVRLPLILPSIIIHKCSHTALLETHHDN